MQVDSVAGYDLCFHPSGKCFIDATRRPPPTLLICNRAVGDRDTALCLSTRALSHTMILATAMLGFAHQTYRCVPAQVAEPQDAVNRSWYRQARQASAL